MHNIVRMAAFELQTANDKEVVKVAGILNRLKSIFKQLADREYAGAITQLREDSSMVQSTADQLKKRIEELTEAINDGDIETYDIALESVRDLTNELAAELQKLNQDAQDKETRDEVVENAPASNAESPAFVPAPEEPMKHHTDEMVKKDPEGIYGKIRNQMPSNHDVPFGHSPAGPKLKSFKWFEQFGPEDIQIPSGTKSGSQNALFEEIVQLVIRVTNLSEKLEESTIEDLIRSRWEVIITNFKQAILDGALLKYVPAKQGRGMATVPVGQVDMEIYTAPFEVVPGAVFECLAVMKDLASSQPATKKLVFRFPKFMRDKASGIAVGLNSSPVRRKSTSIPKPREVPTEILEEKKSSFRLEYLKSLVKEAGINFSASKNLPESFWVKFVQMCGRLGARPEDLAKVINSESGFDPGATNVQGGRIIAKGLNQLIEKTAKSLGMSDAEWKNYENSPAEDQLKYVEKYFRNVGKATGQDGKWSSATQLYVANFAPKYVRQSTDPNSVLYSSKDNRLEYAQNKGLDRDQKGHITAGDLARSVQRNLPTHIVQAIQNASHAVGGNMNASPTTTVPQNDNSVESLLDALVATNDVGPVEKMVRLGLQKKLLPNSNVLITISTLSAPTKMQMKFAQSVSKVLREIIDAESSIHTDGSKIELQCSAAGSQFAVVSAVNALCGCVADAMHLRFKTNVRHMVIPSTLSKFAQLKEHNG